VDPVSDPLLFLLLLFFFFCNVVHTCKSPNCDKHMNLLIRIVQCSDLTRTRSFKFTCALVNLNDLVRVRSEYFTIRINKVIQVYLRSGLVVNTFIGIGQLLSLSNVSEQIRCLTLEPNRDGNRQGLSSELN
jgi:hypothetical protein